MSSTSCPLHKLRLFYGRGIVCLTAAAATADAVGAAGTYALVTVAAAATVHVGLICERFAY